MWKTAFEKLEGIWSAFKFFKGCFHKIYLVHFWIPCLIYYLQGANIYIAFLIFEKTTSSSCKQKLCLRQKLAQFYIFFLHILHLLKQIFKDTFSLEIFLKYTAYEGYFHQSDYLRNLGNSDFLKNIHRNFL